MLNPPRNGRKRLPSPFLAAILAALAIAPCGRCAAAEDLTALEEQAIKAAVARVAPSVVRIETVGGAERIGQLLVGTGPTTGLVVSEDGYVISSAFNFVQKPDSILVTVPGKGRVAAKLVATDHSRKLVLLKLATSARLPVPEVVPESDIRVGQWSIAVGRTYEGDRPNLSVGIVSAVGRVWGKAVQTDAKISPNNYGGPLVDISGRVLGVLAPLSPDGNSDLAGVEWYDSGIGFAVPLSQIMAVLPKLKQGQDLFPGVLGVNLEGIDMFSLPAKLAACRANSPAYKAGLQPGDVIVEAGGHPISRQAQLKYEINSRYAGDKLHLVVLRGEKRVAADVELAETIPPYEYPFLGILPMRPLEGDPAELTVRYVYPEGPAAKAGIQPGDVIESAAGAAVKDAAELREQLRTRAPDEPLRIRVRRGDKKLELNATLARLPEALPPALPPAHGRPSATADARPAVGVVPLKLPELPNECVAYVPENYNPKVSYGVLVWLHAPGGFKQEELIARWKPYCDQHELILLAPKSADPTRWQPSEARFVRRVLAEILDKYSIDPMRIVVHGHEGGGALAYLVAFSSKDVVRGVATVAATMPLLVRPPENDPVYRLAFYTTRASKSTNAAQVEAGIKLLRAMKYPVTVVNQGEQTRYLTAEEIDDLMRWIDALDRI